MIILVDHNKPYIYGTDLNITSKSVGCTVELFKCFTENRWKANGANCHLLVVNF